MRTSMFLVCLMGLASLVSAQTWEIEVVEYGRYFAGIGPCLKLDEAGRPHMLQGAERVLYSWHDGTAWREEVVAQPPPCGRAERASLTLDAEGHPHVAFGYSWITAGGEQWHEELRYAYRDGTGWHVQTVDTQSNGGNWPSLALDSSGRPHISYIDYDGKIWYARRDAAGWHIEALGSPGEEVWPASLAVDAAGNPHLSYVGGISMDVKYARRDASGWHMETVDTLDAWGGLPALTLDAAGNPHIGYGDCANQHLGYAFRNGSGWHLQAVDPQEAAVLGISIALDGAAYPHIGYIGDNGDLRYAYADAGGWHAQTVDSESEPAIFTSLALDGSDHPHIVFHHCGHWIEGPYTVDLRYAYMDAAGWRLQTVATAGWTSRYVSLAVDGAGHPHIGYNFVLWDQSANRVRRWLRYAERDEAGWRLQSVCRDSVDSSMYHEEALSLVLDDGDRVHLAYVSTTFNPTLLTPVGSSPIGF